MRRCNAGAQLQYEIHKVKLPYDEAKRNFRALQPVLFEEGGTVFLGDGLSHQAFWGRAAVDRNEATGKLCGAR